MFHFQRIVMHGPLAALMMLLCSGASCQASDPLEDDQFLARLIEDFLFDPSGAQRVEVETVRRSVWGGEQDVQRLGWLKEGRVYFTDGDNVAAPEAVTEIDFVEECRSAIAPQPAAPDEFGSEDTFRQMRLNALGLSAESDLARAAWLQRLGEGELADQFLGRAKEKSNDDRESARRELREELAWAAFAGMVHAYMVRADEEAISHGDRLMHSYPDEAKEYEQATSILADLKRRQVAGTFAQAPTEEWPDGFEAWSQARKIEFLIAVLDEVDARQWGQPGGVDLASDRRVEALIALGDEAVPALIDTIEKDGRLTRSVHFWRDFSRDRTVLAVREAALSAVMSILRTGVFDPRSTGDNFTKHGDEGIQQVVARLKEYWKDFGGMSFDERMMHVLTDDKSTREAAEEAAHNLAFFGEQRTLGTTVFSGRVGRSDEHPKNPAIDKYSDPTAAEAILAAMDRILAEHDQQPKDRLYDYRRRGIEDAFLGPLVHLGDARIAKELARRGDEAATVRMRRKWSFAAHALRETEPWRRYARDFAAGKIDFPANDDPDANDDDQPGNVELSGAIENLAHAGTVECDDALWALVEPTHPQHSLVARQIVNANPGWPDDDGWFAHPYCLAILRRELDDERPTGAVYVIEDEQLTRSDANSTSTSSIPEALSDPNARRQRVEERACDKAGVQIADLLVGAPYYHPLLKESDKHRGDLASFVERFERQFRRLTPLEADAVGASPWEVLFLPDIRPLERAANADDVRVGRAIFHLDGQGQRSDLKLPAMAELKNRPDDQHPTVLIVQAEVTPDGRTTFGLIERNAIRMAGEDELTNIRPLMPMAEKAADQRDP